MSEPEYSVKIYSSSIAFPLTLFSHAYFVTEYEGKTNRYEVLMLFKDPGKNRYDGNICKNAFAPKQGFSIIGVFPPYSLGPRYRVSLRCETHGKNESAAQRLYDFIEGGGLHRYPYKNRYNILLGPNSNTFTQWVIDQVPECGLSLPWNAWGKGYKK